MKRILAFILLLCVCIGLFACASEKTTETTEPTEPTEPIETIYERTLLNDSDNGARAQMNVGKGTTIHGIVIDIGVSSCMIQLISPKDTSVYVEMPMEQLAKLNENTFISIEGIVSAFDANGDEKYTINAEKILDIEEMNFWVKDEITVFYNMNCLFSESSDVPYIATLDEFDIDLLYAYAELSGDTYRINDDTKLKEYLIGKWHSDFDWNKLHTNCRFGENGYYYLSGAYGQSEDGEWNVEKGKLHTEDHYGPVYVLSDDIFLYENKLYTRQK